VGGTSRCSMSLADGDRPKPSVGEESHAEDASPCVSCCWPPRDTVRKGIGMGKWKSRSVTHLSNNGDNSALLLPVIVGYPSLFASLTVGESKCDGKASVVPRFLYKNPHQKLLLHLKRGGICCKTGLESRIKTIQPF
jgi:hypothetical protein